MPKCKAQCMMCRGMCALFVRCNTMKLVSRDALETALHATLLGQSGLQGCMGQGKLSQQCTSLYRQACVWMGS